MTDREMLRSQRPTSDFLQAAFDATEAVRFIVDPEGVILHFNRKAYENSILLHGRELKPGDNLFDFAADAVNSVENKLKKDLLLAARGETIKRETEIKFQSRSLWYETEYCPVIIDKEIVAVSIYTYDITGRKKQESDHRQILDEIKSTRLKRSQQVEFMLEEMEGELKEIQAELRKSEPARAGMQGAAERLRTSLAGLKKKLGIWKRSG